MPDTLDPLQNPHEVKEHFLQYLRNEVIQLNFYRSHMLYFVVCIAISSVIVYGDGIAEGKGSQSHARLSYIDALFLCCSAMTTTGLNPVNLGSLTHFQQAVLCVLLIIGNIIFVSTFIVLIRRYYFRKKLADIIQGSKAARIAVEDLEQHDSSHDESTRGLRQRRGGNPTEVRDVKKKQKDKKADLHSLKRRYYHRSGYGFFPAPWETDVAHNFFFRLFSRFSNSLKPEHHHYLSFQPKLDPRGRMQGLTEHQRLELGGVEYRALEVLLYILVGYQLLWLMFGVAFLVPYSYRPSVANVLHTSQPGNLNPGWWAFYSVVTEFANGGLNLLNANFIPLQSFYYILIVCGALSLAGQTQFPIFLRLIIWTMEKACPSQSRLRHTLGFLLHHPRRCFIYLFPSKETWYLLAIQMAIDLTAWILFEILNIGMPDVEAIPPGSRTINGLFQATGLRTSGAYIIAFSSLAPALLVAYLVIMYISSFPIVMALRRTNTYEERSIGLDRDDSVGGGLGQHLRWQLAYDMWFQLLAWFLICIVERGKITSSAPGFSIFSIMFEVTSAYGTVGLSTGVPYDQYSLSGAFGTLSKVIMLFVMIRGRHRGLPLAIDRSILLPGEELMHRMDKEYEEKGTFDESEEEELEEDITQSGQKQAERGENVEAQDPEGSAEACRAHQ
ncbi:potassium transport protein 1 [Byssothecium circinans]|uniref:Potassium transport protein 1 n=1 Tax=Byssothecium circinans TaxID=147558 RepID=A0A6A5TJ58_9PLEO|nr:potassium transport protein 1 [Byssothecium circinans]KAF1950846.1 potassium transport protein 1 [Byssothecium circinans]